MQEQPYNNLNPETILSALEKLGFITTGQLLALNSYENRVYEVGVEPSKKLVVKFYRPQRWTDDAILEEHRFAFTCQEREIPVVPPLLLQRRSLHEINGYRYAIFPARGGRAPELEYGNTLQTLGHFIGRLHALGATQAFVHRPTLNAQTYGVNSLNYLLENQWLPPHLESSFKQIGENLLEAINEKYDKQPNLQLIRIHADLHCGNILMDEDKPHIVDFDDCRMGPAIQDMWMFLSANAEQAKIQLENFLNAYQDFCDFDYRELHLIESLRSLRLLHYSAWLARRWQDPAFPMHFSWFNTETYWQQQITDLTDQLKSL